MSGLSWKGDPAATRRHAFARLQDTIAELETVELRVATAERGVAAAKAALAQAEKDVAKRHAERDAARKVRDVALVDLLRAVPVGSDDVAALLVRYGVDVEGLAPSITADRARGTEDVDVV